MKRILLALPIYAGAAMLAYLFWKSDNHPLAIVFAVNVAIFTFVANHDEGNNKQRRPTGK